MKIPKLGEKELIQAIRKSFARSAEGLVLGIGDDAAVIKAGRTHLLLTKDLLIENVHFLASFQPPFFLGRKSLNVNLSDIAAMGGRPRFALLGLGVPPATPESWLEEYFAGFGSAAKDAGVSLIGGDVSQARKIMISVTVIGEGRKIITRGGGKPGHLLYVSGTLGDSRQGLQLLRKGLKMGTDKSLDSLLKAFLDPMPQLSLGVELSRLRLASSMIDISDGLSVDLGHLCQESRVGAEVFLENIPLSSNLLRLKRKPQEFALHGGEDYQLLFSVPPERKTVILKHQKKYRITCIGRMTRGKGMFLIDRQGRRKPLSIKGYQHFSRV